MPRPSCAPSRTDAATCPVSGRDAPSWHRTAAPLVIVVAGLIAYSNSFGGVFIYDDFHAIQQNPYIRSLHTAFSAPPQASLAGRPIASLSFALTYALFEYDARGYHAVNLAIHLLAGLALFGVVRRTLLSARLRDRFGAAALPLATAIAILWTVHPLQTQAVTYIIQRAESLVGLFYLTTLYCAIRAMETGRFSIWTVAAVLACALGMGTKEVMATAPVVVLLHDVLFYARSPRMALLKRWSLYLGIAAGWFILVALMAGGPRSESVGFGLKEISPWAYLRSQAGVILHYVGLALWPRTLVLDYAWPVAMNWREYLVPFLIVLTATAITLHGVLRQRAWAILPAAFLVILAPTSSIVPINDLCFEQRMYLSLAAVIVAVVLMVKRGLDVINLPARREIGAGLTIVAIVLLTTLTVARNADYHDSLHLWGDTVSKRPLNARAQSALGTEYLVRERFVESVPIFERAVELEPRSWRYLENLGRAYYKAKRHDDSVRAYQRAIELASGQYTLYYNLGVCYTDMGRHEDAIQSYVRALRCDPNAYQAHFNLGNAFLKLKRPREAEAAFRRVLELRPGFEKAIAALDLLGARGK